jgi:hypothetical protein
MFQERRSMASASGKIAIDSDKVIKEYPGHNKLPPSMHALFERMKAATAKINAESKKWNDDHPDVPPEKKKKMLPMPTPCVFQVCHALNKVGGEHLVPFKKYKPNDRDPTVLDGMNYLGNVAELESYLKERYGAPEVLKPGAANTRAAMEKAIGGRRGIIAFREGWAGAHTEIWDRSRVLQNGAPVGDSKGAIGTMNQDWMWARPTILFWEMVAPGAASTIPAPRWLEGWWRVVDIGQVYYYYFYPNGDIFYTKNAPGYNYCPVTQPSSSGRFTMSGPQKIDVKWNDEDYNVEQFAFIGPVMPPLLVGTYVGIAALPFAATKYF